MNRTGIRLVGAAMTASALAIALTGCVTWPESELDVAACELPGVEGTASTSITADGAFGELSGATLPHPLSVTALETTRDGVGTGDPVTPSGVVRANFELLDGAGGEVLVPYSPTVADESGASAPTSVATIANTFPGLAEAIECSQTGERVVAVMPASVLFGEAAASTGVDPAMTIVAIADVLDVYPSSAGGRIAAPEDGIPAVVTAPNGTPGVTMPAQEPPAAPKRHVRIDGYGSPVAEGQAVTMQLSAFDWTTGEQVASTWTPGNNVLQLTMAPTDGLFGLSQEIVGTPVGSQLVVVLPPERLASQPGPLNATATQGRTLVFVIDILAAE